MTDTCSNSTQNRIYSNAGNIELLKMLEIESGRLLDVGCGAGDNARWIKKKYSQLSVVGITHSHEESIIAREIMDECLVMDIETNPRAIAESDNTFDVLLFSHVLEHLRNPDQVVADFLPMLKSGGQLLIAVPNVLSWRMRLQFIFGDFQYQCAGVLDDTHLRFFTFITARKYLLSKSVSLVDVREIADGGAPLWIFRRKIFTKDFSKKIDLWCCKHWPNLFGSQILISAKKR